MEELAVALRICELHGAELLPDTVEVFRGCRDYADWYIQALNRLFPHLYKIRIAAKALANARRPIIYAGGQPTQEVHTGCIRLDVQQPSQITRRRVEQDRLALGVQPSADEEPRRARLKSECRRLTSERT